MSLVISAEKSLRTPPALAKAKDPFPLKFRQEENFGSHHMITEVTISKNGCFDAVTETNNHVL